MMSDGIPIVRRLLEAIADSEHDHPGDDRYHVDLTRKDAIDAVKCITELRAQISDPVSFKCGARHANTGANDPAECDWPVCGCDPYATKVIEALQESGVLK